MTEIDSGTARRGRGQRRSLAVIGAPSNIGIRPYDGEREPRHLDRAPETLRALGLVERLGAIDLGDVIPPPYRDLSRPPGGIRNEEGVLSYSRDLADRVGLARRDGRFAVVLGGDCSIVLGSLLGAASPDSGIGLAYVDAHADFATPAESLTGSAASMCLALAVGRGESPLARLNGARPLVRAEDVVLIGRRDRGENHYGEAALDESGLLDLADGRLQEEGGTALSSAAVERLGRAELEGFWIHVDADVLDPSVMPAVDSPEPGGPGLDELAGLVRPLADHPGALGMQLTIYDPALDPDGSCAGRLVTLLARILTDQPGGGI